MDVHHPGHYRVIERICKLTRNGAPLTDDPKNGDFGNWLARVSESRGYEYGLNRLVVEAVRVE